MSAKKPAQDCCVVTIGFTTVLLPATDGLKVMALLRNAVEVDRDYSGHHERWLAGERPRCEMTMVSPKDVRPKIDQDARPARGPRLLGHD